MGLAAEILITVKSSWEYPHCDATSGPGMTTTSLYGQG